MDELLRAAPFCYRRTCGSLLLRYCDLWPEFFTSPQYTAWQDGRTWQLVVYGAPQCGKSTLAAAVSRDLESRSRSGRSAVVTIFINRVSDEGRSIPTTNGTIISASRLLLLAFLRQLTEADSSPALANRMQAFSPDMPAAHLEMLVNDCISHFDRVSAVMDAADQVEFKDFVEMGSTISWLADKGVSVFATRSFRTSPSVRRKCDLCGQSGLSLYWRCQDCMDDSFDVCYSCYNRGIHDQHCIDSNHTMHEEYREVEVELRASKASLAPYIQTELQTRLRGHFSGDGFTQPKGQLERLEQRVLNRASGLLVMIKLPIDHFLDHRNFDELLYPQRAILSSEAALFDSLVHRLRIRCGSIWYWIGTALMIMVDAKVSSCIALSFEELRDAVALCTNQREASRPDICRTEFLHAFQGLIYITSEPDPKLELFHTDFANHVHQRPSPLSDLPAVSLAELSASALHILPEVDEPHQIEASLSALISKHPFLAYAARSWGFLAGICAMNDRMSIVALDPRMQATFCWIAYSTSTQSSAPFDVPPGSTALHLHAHFGLVSLSRSFMDAESDLNARDTVYGRTALMMAARNGHASMVKLLLQSGADPALRCWQRCTALYEAVTYRHSEVADVLLKHSRGVYTDCVGKEPASTLSQAIRNRDHELANRLAGHPCIDINSSDTQDLTPLMAALRSGDQLLVKLLFQRPDLRLDFRNERGMTATHFAAIFADYPTLDFIVAHCLQKKDFSLFDQYHASDLVQTPLMLLLSCKRANDALTLALLQRIAPFCSLIAQADSRGRTLLHYAAQGKNSSCIEFLVRQGIDVDIKDKSGWTPIHVACCLGETSAVEQLLRLEASRSVADTSGLRPADVLQLYARDGEPGITGLFPQHTAQTTVTRPMWSRVITRQLPKAGFGASASDQDPFYGDTALHWAVRLGDLDAIRTPLVQGALNVINFSGQTALHIAVASNKADLTTLLLDKGADPTIPLGRRSALGLARQLHSIDASLLLIEHSSEPLEHGLDLDELLFAAVEKKKIAVIRKLLSAGANVLRRDSSGRLVTHVAVDVGLDPETLGFLRRQQAAELMRIWPQNVTMNKS